jgi:hypothetical protein
MQYERERGELRPVTPQNEIKDYSQTLAAKLYRAMELDAIRMLMKNGERIVKVDWHVIEADSK